MTDIVKNIKVSSTKQKNILDAYNNSFVRFMQIEKPQPIQDSNEVRWTEDNKAQLMKSISGPGFRGVKIAK